MWSLILDWCARLVRADRRPSQLRRLSLVDDALADASAHGARGAFAFEPWRYGVPESVIVQLARRRGYRLDGATGDWSVREPFHFVAAGSGFCAAADGSGPGVRISAGSAAVASGDATAVASAGRGAAR